MVVWQYIISLFYHIPQCLKASIFEAKAKEENEKVLEILEELIG